MIEVDGLTRIYHCLRAVDDLSFRVEPGEIVALAGPNGSGKTTTLRCIAGIIPATFGDVRINSYSILKNPLEAKRTIGFLPEEPQLFEHLTVKEHLQFTAAVYGVKNFETRVSDLLEELDLLETANLLPHELSRGMKQKLALACSLIHEPTNLLLDEPLTGLDIPGARRVKEIILSRARRGAAVLVSSHCLALIEEICNRVLILKQGRKAMEANLKELVQERCLLGRSSELEEIFMRAVDSGYEKV